MSNIKKEQNHGLCCYPFLIDRALYKYFIIIIIITPSVGFLVVAVARR